VSFHAYSYRPGWTPGERGGSRPDIKKGSRVASAVSQDIRERTEHCRAGRYPAGIYGEAEGFEPYRNEIKLERASPSPLIDACPRDHKVIYECDASASHAIDEMLADEGDRADSKPGIYGDVIGTADRIEQTLPRKLRNGKNAGG